MPIFTKKTPLTSIRNFTRKTVPQKQMKSQLSHHKSPLRTLLSPPRKKILLKRRRIPLRSKSVTLSMNVRGLRMTMSRLRKKVKRHSKKEPKKNIPTMRKMTYYLSLPSRSTSISTIPNLATCSNQIEFTLSMISWDNQRKHHETI